MSVRTVRRRGQAPPPKTKRKPLVGRVPNPRGSIQQRFERDMALETGLWTKVSFQCRRCGALYVTCLNTGVEIKDDPLPPCSDPPSPPRDLSKYGPGRRARIEAKRKTDKPRGCEWGLRGWLSDSGQYPWLVDMPGCYGPGDVFEIVSAHRVFIGRKTGGGEWRELQPGTYEVVEECRVERVTS